MLTFGPKVRGPPRWSVGVISCMFAALLQFSVLYVLNMLKCTLNAI